MKIDTPRGWSNTYSTNNSRELFVYLSISSIPYAERMLAYNNSFLQTKQVDNNIFQFFLFYAIPEIEDTVKADKTTVTINMLELQEEYVNCYDLSFIE